MPPKGRLFIHAYFTPMVMNALFPGTAAMVTFPMVIMTLGEVMHEKKKKVLINNVNLPNSDDIVSSIPPMDIVDVHNYLENLIEIFALILS